MNGDYSPQADGRLADEKNLLVVIVFRCFKNTHSILFLSCQIAAGQSRRHAVMLLPLEFEDAPDEPTFLVDTS